MSAQASGGTAARTVRINGEPRVVPAATLGALLASLGIGPEAAGIAVAVNGEVVPRASWAARPIHEDDEIDVVGAVQGG